MVKALISTDMLNRIFFIAERVLVFDGINSVFEHIIKTAAQLTNADAAAIRLFDMDAGELKLIRGYDSSDGFFEQLPVGLSEGISGHVVMTGKQYGAVDISKDKKISKKEIANIKGVKTALCIPLRTKDRALGCITVFRRNREKFSDQEILLLNIFASQAVVAIEKTKLVDELEKQAKFDALTGLHNAGSLYHQSEMLMKLALRYSYEVSIVFLKVEDFEQFNKTHGSLLGDKLLMDISRIISQKCRNTDIGGRIADEQFAVIVPYTGKDGGYVLADKICRAVSSSRFVGKKGKVKVSLRSDVVSFPNDGFDIPDMLINASTRIFKRKKKSAAKTLSIKKTAAGSRRK
ncbi:MAG: sensor domain-containing diguanylate cyclase [Dissulfurispiraceae bacterium]|jgi:diguanylate cyclase (GGDEF)-like protein|nr:sensor domain-containing diguanylate cyclase [Dissulfurispiraceae bacterium]